MNDCLLSLCDSVKAVQCVDHSSLPVAHGSSTAALSIVLKAVLLVVTPRGSALQKRLRDREKEMEADERDRKREKEELEEIRQRLLDEGHPDPDAELRRVSVCGTLCLSEARICVRTQGEVCCGFEGHYRRCPSASHQQ